MARNRDIEQMCVVGAGLNQPILLATQGPNAQQRPRADLEAGLHADLRRVTATLAEHERIARCIIVDDPWTTDHGLPPLNRKTRPRVLGTPFATLNAPGATAQAQH